MPAKPTSRRPRGIATAGILFHPSNTKGDCMTAWCTRATVGTVREVFNLGYLAPTPTPNRRSSPFQIAPFFGRYGMLYRVRPTS
jgi:hypothetical protein